MAVGAGGRAAWPSNDDFTFLSLAVIAIGLGFLGWVGWTNYHGEISGVIAAVARWQIGIVGHFTRALDGLDQTIATANFDAVTAREILIVFNVIGGYLRIPVIAVILVLAVVCFARAAPSRFTRKFDLDGLIREQALFFGAIAAFARRNLRLAPMRPDIVRPSDPALHPREWVTRFACRAGAGPNGAGEFDPIAATRAFAKQLGPMWRGVEQAPGHVRILYAVFVLHLEQRRSEAEGLLGALSLALPHGEPDETSGPPKAYSIPPAVVASADAVLESVALRERADAIAAGHAYTAPALMSLLTTARHRSGVLAPAQFACVKLVDRGLWYALHSLGFEGDGPGQTTHPNPRVEAAGARDHWAAERLAGRPLVIPSVDRAVAAVRASLGQDDPNNRFSETT